MKDISDKTFFVTGATDGLGKLLALRLAKRGARVLLHGRNPEKGQKVLEELERATGNGSLEYFNADFSRLSDIAAMGRDVGARGRVDVLVNNAGVGGGPKSPKTRELSADGHELRFAVNYLSQVLTTRELLTLIPSGGRIINVASIAQTELDFDDLELERGYESHRAYAQSKLALIMYTFDLAEKLKGRGISANALHPATLMNTNMVAEHFDRVASTVEEGCDALEYLATDEELEGVTGEYFEGKNKARAKPQAYDPKARKKLEAVTEKLIAASI